MPGTDVTLRNRWRSQQLVGEAKHTAVVRVRAGHMTHKYGDAHRLDTGSPIYPPLIWKGHNHHPWQGFWVIDGPWIRLPNIASTKWGRSFQDKGTSSATVVMENVNFAEHEGVAGVFHTIERGYFSPMKGVKVVTRPKLWDTNEWEDVLNGGYQIELWEGYAGESALANAGDDGLKRTWTGIVEDCDMESSPDKITLTARDYTVFLTDQRLMGLNKAAEIRSPVTFADRRRTQGQKGVYANARASSGRVMHDDDGRPDWNSDPNGDSSAVEWIEIDLKAGYYEDFYFDAKYDGMDLYVSLHMGTGGGTRDRTHHVPAGWVDLGLGNVPGGGPDYIKYHRRVSADPSRRWPLGGHSWDVPPGSKLRLSFSHLVNRQHRAGVNTFQAYWFGNDPSKAPGMKVNAKHWVLVEDAADVVRMVLIWAGFKEWHVEDFGFTLAHPLTYHEDKFLMDIITDLLAQADFVFHMDGPTEHELSLGVPHFEPQQITSTQRGMPEVRDTDMTEALEAKWDLTDLPYVMRYRGDISKKHGKALGEDRTRRYQATYYPPWSGYDFVKNGTRVTHRRVPISRVAGIRRHFTETIGANTTLGLNSEVECLFACILAAIQYALGMCTGQFQIAGLPIFALNSQVSVVDEGTGLNSRLWIASIESENTMGQNGKYTMTIGGSLIDTEDMGYLRADFEWATRLYKRRRRAI